jgi:hypothetical protein
MFFKPDTQCMIFSLVPFWINFGLVLGSHGPCRG